MTSQPEVVARSTHISAELVGCQRSLVSQLTAIRYKMCQCMNYSPDLAPFLNETDDLCSRIGVLAVSNEPFHSDATDVSVEKVQKVLGVPELFEMVLQNLKARDLLSVCCVSRVFAQGVLKSKKIQKRLQVVPQPDAHYSTPFEFCSGFTGLLCKEWYDVDFSSDFSLDEYEEEVLKLRVEFAPDIKLRIGDRCRAILICQPPITHLDVTMDCCDHLRYGDFPDDVDEEDVPRFWLKPLDAAGGLTVGDVWDYTVKLRKEHDPCPYASVDYVKYADILAATPYFTGDLRLKANDPVRLARRATERDVDESDIVRMKRMWADRKR